jgi:hypothetical protein
MKWWFRAIRANAFNAESIFMRTPHSTEATRLSF